MAFRLPLTLAVLALLAPATAAFADETLTLNKYTVTVTLSPKAREGVTAAKERVRVAAYYYGEALDPNDGDEMAQIQMGVEHAFLTTDGTVTLGGIQVPKGAVARSTPDGVWLLINVTTAFDAGEYNMISCGFYQDAVAKAVDIPIECKLIGE